VTKHANTKRALLYPICYVYIPLTICPYWYIYWGHRWTQFRLRLMWLIMWQVRRVIFHNTTRINVPLWVSIGSAVKWLFLGKELKKRINENCKLINDVNSTK